jgi:ATP synthase protein I
MMGRTLKNRRGIKVAQRLLMWQLALMVLLAIAAFLLSGMKAGLSALLGGLVCIIPNAYFARKLFQYHGARAAKKIVNSFYKGEALKMLMTVALFALVFKFFTVLPLVFFVVYIVVQMVVWFAPLLVDNNERM